MKKTNGGPLNKFFLKILSFSVSLASNPTSEGCLEERVLMKACQNLCYCDREFWQVQFQIPNSTLAATLVFLPFRPLFRLSPPWPIYLSFFQQSLLLQLQQLSLKFFIFSSSPEKLFFLLNYKKDLLMLSVHFSFNSNFCKVKWNYIIGLYLNVN